MTDTFFATAAPKRTPSLIAADEERFEAVADAIARERADLATRLGARRRAPARAGQLALERDLEIHRLSARLGALERARADACLGRIVPQSGEPLYIGRLGLTDHAERILLVDWRAEAAEPFFAATLAAPMGLVSRRRFRWADGVVRDYWDEAFTEDTSGLALDDDSALLASLGAHRAGRMRDVLATIQADQDAIIRADAAGALVVDGGPGTGKTVVALHRAAYLLHADPRLREGRGGVLFVGPNERYLAYTADVLPRLGEESVQTCTVRDLVAEGARARAESDPAVTALKSDIRMVDAIEPAVRLYEEPPRRTTIVGTAWADLTITPADWAVAFQAVEPGTPHNEARDQVRDALLDLLTEQAGDADPARLRHALERDDELAAALARAWPIVEASVLVADLWSVPAYLRRCAPWLEPAEVAALQRADATAWTDADLPLLDAARHRLGDPTTAARDRRRRAALDAEREYMANVVDRLKEAGDEMLTWLDGEDLRASLVDEAAVERIDPDLLAGPFAHVIVDEAQELTDAEWQMLVRRCPARSLTVVGDRAQARRGFTETWEQRLARVGLHRVRRAPLRVNYRTPAEVMREAAPVILAALPDADVPESIRSSGLPVRRGVTGDLDDLLDGWLAENPDGVACVIGDSGVRDRPRVSALTPRAAKGLEFDLVVLVEPGRWGDGIPGAVDRYVAMTRATRELIVLS